MTSWTSPPRVRSDLRRMPYSVPSKVQRRTTMLRRPVKVSLPMEQPCPWRKVQSVTRMSEVTPPARLPALTAMQSSPVSIVQWVMSCRVLGYQIEQAVMATIIDIIAGGATVEGTLIETEVNFPCRSLFASCGFERDGTRWYLPQGARVALPRHVTIRSE